MASTSSDSDDLLLGDFLDEEDLRFLEPQEVRRLIWEQVPWLPDTSPRPVATERVSLHWVGR